MTTQHSAQPEFARIQLLRSHLCSRPNDGRAWLELARILARLAPTDELYHALEQAIKSMPENDDAWLLAASIQQRERGLPAALKWLEHSARENPGLAAPRRVADALRSGGVRNDTWARADAFRESGKWREALDEYRSVEQIRPDDPLLLNNIGSCLASLEQNEAAFACFENALRLKPDFAEARLNIGLLCARLSRRDEAVRWIGEALQGTSLNPATRPAAETLHAILREHERLEPLLLKALEHGDMRGYQQAMNEAPAKLCQPHAQTVATLRSLAARFRELALDDGTFRYTASTGALPFMEAFALCNLAGGREEIARIYQEVNHLPADPAVAARHPRLLHVLRVIQDRMAHRADLLQGPEGEAWLKYWHARLLRDAPSAMPGQYKPTANSIAGLPLTPAANVAGTVRTLLSEIRPAVPPGLRRGLFMYVAVNMIHGFSDGNGRLGRFLLAWEAEAAGLRPILVPLNVRAEVARTMDAVWLGGDLQPLMEAIGAGHAATDRLLGELQ